MRMVYKVLGLNIPKPIRKKLVDQGVEFIEYWPADKNVSTHETHRSTLGLIDLPNPGDSIPLLSELREQKEERGPNIIEVEYALRQS